MTASIDTDGHTEWRIAEKPDRLKPPAFVTIDIAAGYIAAGEGHPIGNGGAEGDRTTDLCNAIAALSQLSYGPNPAGRRLH